MNKEEKQLLLKDLCARIPYHTLVQLNPGAYNKPETCLLTGVHGEKVHLNVDSDPFRVDNIKPYLRPMSSMAEEEKKEFDDFCVIDVFVWEGNVEIGYKNQANIMSDGIDWLLEHHFDFKGLIEKGLALEAPEGMYKED